MGEEEIKELRRRVDILDHAATKHQAIIDVLTGRIGNAERRIGELERKVG